MVSAQELGACMVSLSRKGFGFPLLSPASLLMAVRWAL